MKNEEWELAFLILVKSEEWKVKSEKWRVKNRAVTVPTAFTVGLLSNLTDDVQKKRRKVFFIPKLLLPLQSQVKK